MKNGDRPFIITATVAPADLAPFTALRDRFFPPHRNYLPAHLTLFHQIPAHREAEYLEAARHVSAGIQPFAARVAEPVNLGRGVAYPVMAEQLFDLRAGLRSRLLPYLAKQDSNPWKRPHLTVQNKVHPTEADRLLRHLRYRYRECSIRIIGISRYRYEGGPWTLVDRIAW